MVKQHNLLEAWACCYKELVGEDISFIAMVTNLGLVPRSGLHSNKHIAWMRIAVHEAVIVDHVGEHLADLGHHIGSLDSSSLETSNVVDEHAVDILHRQDALGGQWLRRCRCQLPSDTRVSE